ncbi:MAG: metallophosphoesterase [Chloroflexales bacterium]
MDFPELVILLADIHANDAALGEVIRDARRRYGHSGALRLWFLGDLFGRGPEPARVWRMLMTYNPEVMLLGNHEYGLFGWHQNIPVAGGYDGGFNREDWTILAYHRRYLEDLGLLQLGSSGWPTGGDILDVLGRAPIVATPRPGIYLVHGGADRRLAQALELGNVRELVERLVWGYVREPHHVIDTLETLRWLHEQPPAHEGWQVTSVEPPAIIVVGHTHRRTLARLSETGEVLWERSIKLDIPYQIRFSTDQPVLLSPGSVGFAREERDRDASYAALEILGSETCRVTFHTVPYDRIGVCAEMRARAYPEQIVRLLALPGKQDL